MEAEGVVGEPRIEDLSWGRIRIEYPDGSSVLQFWDGTQIGVPSLLEVREDLGDVNRRMREAPLKRAEEAREARRTETIRHLELQLGNTLAEAVYNYGYIEEYRTPEEYELHRQGFIEAVVDTLASGTREDQIKGLSALLKGIEAKIERVASIANDANLRIKPIG